MAGSVTAEDFESDAWLKTFIARKVVDSKILLVLGSGISMPLGLPDFNGLINKLYKDVRAKPPKGEEASVAAETFKLQYCNNDDALLIEKLRSALYRGIDLSPGDLLEHRHLAAIGALCIAAARSGVCQVVSLNYDDLLETYLEQMGLRVERIFAEEHWKPTGDVVVYHPHGFVPLNETHGASRRVVLDFKSYASIGPGLRQELNVLFKQSFCIFIGLSGRDNHMNDLLTDVEPLHVTRSEGIPRWGVASLSESDKPGQLIFQNRSIHAIEIASWKSTEYPDFIFDIVAETNKQR